MLRDWLIGAAAFVGVTGGGIIIASIIGHYNRKEGIGVYNLPQPTYPQIPTRDIAPPAATP